MKAHDLKSVTEKHKYVELTEEEARRSRATYQHKSAWLDEELTSLTLWVDSLSDEWKHFDHRGDLSKEGTGPEELDAYLAMFHADDEDEE